MKYIFFLFIFCSPLLGFAQQAEIVDFTKANVQMTIHPDIPSLVMGVVYEFEILKDTDSIYLDAKNIDQYEITNKSFEGSARFTGDKIVLKSNFKKGAKHTLGFFGVIIPSKTMYFIDWDINEDRQQVWTQGQGKYTSNWLPSLDDVNDKIEFDFSIRFDKAYEVIANGKLIKKETINDSLVTWHYDMKQPMSSYLAAIAIGKYEKKVDTSTSGIPLEMYYYPEDEAKFEPTYRHTKQIFDFLEEEIGVAYPWQNYKQVPVKDFLYAGMENTSLTIFSDSFVVDSIGFVDKNYVNVNAHELAHQWFGNLVTAKSGEHHWLQEGFATYYALLAEKEIFGDDYFYWKLYQSALQLQALNDGKGESLLNPKASSLTFYQKGAWALHVLRTKVGEKSFKNAVQRYLNTYKFKSAETNDFIKIVEAESGQNLNAFVKTWLEAPQLPENFYSYEKLLTQNSSTNESMFAYLGGMKGSPAQVASFRMSNSQKESATICVNIGRIVKLFNDDLVQEEAPISEELVVNLVKNLPKETSEIQISAYKEAFQTNNIKVRQAIAQTLSKIPLELKLDYESLLNDESYETKEAALYNLWSNFPENRKQYLDQTKNIQGFSDKSFRMLWLALAIVTKNYSGHDTPYYYNELSGYTNTKYHFEIRQNAFIFINELQSFTDKNLADLVNGALHHNWRFATFCRELLDDLIKKEIYKPNFERTMNLLTEKEKAYLTKKMSKN